MTYRARFLLVNGITVLRFVLVLLFLPLGIVHAVRGAGYDATFAAGLGILAVAALTDMIDGYLARRLAVVSRFGACMDPLADKVFYAIALPFLLFLAASNGHTTHALILLVLVVFLLLRDLWVSFLRAVAAGTSMDLRANWSGKLRTALVFPLVGIVYAVEAGGPHGLVPAWLYGLEALAFVVNVVSALVYTRRYWRYVVATVTGP